MSDDSTEHDGPSDSADPDGTADGADERTRSVDRPPRRTPEGADALRSAAMKAVSDEEEHPTPARTPEPDRDDLPPTGPPDGPPAVALTPGDGDDGGGPNRLLVGLGIAAAVALLVGLIVVLLPGGDDGGLEGDAISTGERVVIDESDRTTSTTTEPTTTTTEPTTETTEPATTTTTEPTTETTEPATTTTQATTTTTRPPAPADITVTYPRDSQGRMILLEGGTGAVILNNVGGSPGSYSVVAAGEVSVVGGGSGTIEAGQVISVSVQAGTGVTAPPPQGTVTVSDAGGTIVTIDVVIT